jgi:hypothetical protein
MDHGVAFGDHTREPGEPPVPLAPKEPRVDQQPIDGRQQLAERPPADGRLVGPPQHDGRSWTSSGATTATRCCAVSPPTRSWICSVQVSLSPRAATWHEATMRASSVGGPSGSPGETMIARDG